MRRSLLLPALAMAAMTCAARAAPNSPARLEAFARLPDWTGIWRAKGGFGLIEPSAPSGSAGGGAVIGASRDHPPYNPAWESRYVDALAKVQVEGDAAAVAGHVDSNLRYCAAGWPRLFSGPFIIQYVVTPEETLALYEQREVRHIYTDGRPHPPRDDLWPTFWGHSVGRWEGDTLVVDTVALKGGLWIDPSGATLSDEAHTTERIRLIDPDTLEDALTIEDPVALTRPWTLKRQYGRMPQKAIWFTDEICQENDLNPVVGGKLTTMLPGEAR